MFKIGDILVHKSEACEVIVVAIEKGYYRARHISGIFDTEFLKVENPQEWFIFGNIFEKGGGGQ